MRVRVLYFGVLKDIVGCEREELELPEGSIAGTVLQIVEQRGQVAPGVWRSLAIAVNHEYVRASVALQAGDEVALLPPVSGGSHAR